MIAVVPVREGRLPAGADAAVVECAGRVLAIGEATRDAIGALRVEVREAFAVEAGPFAPAAWAAGLVAPLRDEPGVVLPGSPDGRDLLGRLAAELGRPAHAWCTRVGVASVTTTRHDGATTVEVPVAGPFVATLVPRQVAAVRADAVAVRDVELGATARRDATVARVEDVDPAELDLADAARIVAGGVGLGGAESFAVLAEVAAGLRAAMGATRPVADRGLVGHERQIGTTGVAVDPTLYVAFGISGAVQHTAGLGAPSRVIAVNTDPSCPMMAMADLAVVADAPATLRALAARLQAAPS